MNGVIGKAAYRDWWTAAACGIGYLLLAVGTTLLTADKHEISTIWPANALVLATILPLRPHRWPPYFVAAFLGNLLGNFIAFDTAAGPVFFGLADMAEILIAALLLRKGRTRDNALEDVRSVLRFMLLGGMIAPAVGGLLGAATAQYLEGESFWASYSTWYIADALGLMIFTPLFSGVVSGEMARGIRELSPAARIEAILLLTFVIVTGLFTFLVANYPALFVMSAAVMLGVEIPALVGNTLCTFIDERDRRAFNEVFFQALGDPGTVAYCEFRPRGRQSDWLECTLRALVDQDGKVYGAISAIRDITLRKERELSLSRAASTDSLTGMLNHAAFMAHIDHALAHLGSSHLALVMIDVDHFKQVNDRHGHPAGDAVLVELTARLRALLRDHDAIGRLGGDELAILLDGTTQELALSIAETLRATISGKPFLLRGGKTQAISISCGVAQAHRGISRSDLLRQADQALYRAKGDGRDRVTASAL